MEQPVGRGADVDEGAVGRDRLGGAVGHFTLLEFAPGWILSDPPKGRMNGVVCLVAGGHAVQGGDLDSVYRYVGCRLVGTVLLFVFRYCMHNDCRNNLFGWAQFGGARGIPLLYGRNKTQRVIGFDFVTVIRGEKYMTKLESKTRVLFSFWSHGY